MILSQRVFVNCEVIIKELVAVWFMQQKIKYCCSYVPTYDFTLKIHTCVVEKITRIARGTITFGAGYDDALKVRSSLEPNCS